MAHGKVASSWTRVVTPVDATMDADLKDAATFGNVKYLNEALNSKPFNYFLLSTESKYNILHIAVRFKRKTFIDIAIQELPDKYLHLLLSQQEISLQWNPLHFEAFQGRSDLISFTHKLFKKPNYGKDQDDVNIPSQFPWLIRDEDGNIPLHLAIKNHKSECAISILQEDERSQCNIVDKEGNTPLFLAVSHRLPDVALHILKSDDPVSVMGQGGLNPLHILQQISVESAETEKWLTIEKLLIQKHEPLLELRDDKNGNTILHLWAKANKLSLLPELIKLQKIMLLSMLKNYNGNIPLHLAIEHGNEDFALYLVRKCGKLDTPLWRYENGERLTPFDVALSKRLEKFVLHCIPLDSWTYNQHNSEGKSRLYVAAEKGMNKVVREICKFVRENPTTESFTNKDGETVLHAIKGCEEETGRLVVRQFRDLIKNPVGEHRKRPLDVASECGKTWLIKELLENEPDSITVSPKAWIVPCQRSDLEALKLFTRCSDKFKKVIGNQDSPLHHIKLETIEEYEKLLAIPPLWEMKNNCDFDGQTPLHRALERKNLLFAEVLLKDGVDCSISGMNDKTAKDLLADLCKEHYEWHTLCKKMNLNPWLKTRYIQDTSTLGKVRDTLAVVAALLATLTFAAGFTLPGGLNQDTGEALVGTKASFLVFILADTYAMCCSMFVLFCLIWSMVCDEMQSHVLIDRSVLALVHSFCGTLVAFMTGIYTVLSHKSLWASILIIVMTSFVAVISCNKTFLYKVVAEWIPSIPIPKPHRIATRTMALLKKGTCEGDNSQKTDPLSNA